MPVEGGDGHGADEPVASLNPEGTRAEAAVDSEGVAAVDNADGDADAGVAHSH